MARREDRMFGDGRGRPDGPDGGKVSAERSRDNMIRRSLDAGLNGPARPATATAPARPMLVSAEAARLAMIRRSR